MKKIIIFTLLVLTGTYTIGQNNKIEMKLLTSFSTGGSGSTAEIVTYDPASKRLFVANSGAKKLDILNCINPASITIISSIDLSVYGGGVNGVDVKNGMVAVSVDGFNPQENGKVVFFNSSGVYLNSVTVGAMPDMVVFTPDGMKVLTANEGEPNFSYSVDPEGSISIIDISEGIETLTQSNVTTVSFTSFNSSISSLKAMGVRIFGPGATVAQDLEPEYITISADSKKAWITLQENNAFAILDIENKVITEIKPLGFKDHSIAGNGLDGSDVLGSINIATWPVKGMYLPDAIASYNVGGQTFLITANEGDAREYSTFEEEEKIKSSSYPLDPIRFPDAASLKNTDNIGNLKVTKTLGDTDGDGDFDEIYTFGGRSFSIWDKDGNLVYDSGDNIEQTIASDPIYSSIFNCSNSNVTKKNRSDDKGPEPEGVAIGQIGESIYSFIGLERVGGIMVYDVTNPYSPSFVQYINNRSLSSATGDLGPEGIIFISKEISPNKRNLIVLANEVSSTVSVYQVDIKLNESSEVKLKKYELKNTPVIGTYGGQTFYEGGISGIDALGSGGIFYGVSDRGPNVPVINSPLAIPGTQPLVFPFPNYAPKIFMMKTSGDSLVIKREISIKRPDRSHATGLPNPPGSGSTGEIAWSDSNATVHNPDFWGLDPEGIVAGQHGDFWICEEYGTSIWQVSKGTGKVIRRYTPFGKSGLNFPIDTVFGKRRANRGFEGIALTPGGKVYAIVQSPLNNPNAASGNASRLHRIIELDPQTGATRMFAYEHDAPIGAIANKDWKIGDMVAVNDQEFLVLEHAESGAFNFKNIYKIDLSGATPITSEYFSGETFEQLNVASNAEANGIIPVSKTLLLDLLENGWEITHDKPEGITIVNENTIAVINDNDFGITSPGEDGRIAMTGKTTKLYVYTLPQSLNLQAPHRSGLIADEEAGDVSGDFVVYPNPSNGEKVTFNKMVSIDVFNILGNKILQKSNVESLDVSELEKGIYLIKNSNGEVQRLVIN